MPRWVNLPPEQLERQQQQQQGYNNASGVDNNNNNNNMNHPNYHHMHNNNNNNGIASFAWNHHHHHHSSSSSGILPPPPPPPPPQPLQQQQQQQQTTPWGNNSSLAFGGAVSQQQQQQQQQQWQFQLNNHHQRPLPPPPPPRVPSPFPNAPINAATRRKNVDEYGRVQQQQQRNAWQPGSFVPPPPPPPPPPPLAVDNVAVGILPPFAPLARHYMATTNNLAHPTPSSLGSSLSSFGRQQQQQQLPSNNNGIIINPPQVVDPIDPRLSRLNNSRSSSNNMEHTKDRPKRRLEEYGNESSSKQPRIPNNLEAQPPPGNVRLLASLMERVETLLLANESFNKKSLTASAANELANLVDQVKACPIPNSDVEKLNIAVAFQKLILTDSAAAVLSGRLSPKSLGSQLRSSAESCRLHGAKITEKNPHLMNTTGEPSERNVFATCFLLNEALTAICISEAWARNFTKRMAKACVPLEKIRLCLVFLDRRNVKEVVELLSANEIRVVEILMANGRLALRPLEQPSLDLDTQLEKIGNALKTVKVKKDQLSFVADAAAEIPRRPAASSHVDDDMEISDDENNDNGKEKGPTVFQSHDNENPLVGGHARNSSGTGPFPTTRNSTQVDQTAEQSLSDSDSADMDMSDEDKPNSDGGDDDDRDSRRPLVAMQDVLPGKTKRAALKARQLAALKAKRLALQKKIEAGRRGVSPTAPAVPVQFEGDKQSQSAGDGSDKVSPPESGAFLTENHDSAESGSSPGVRSKTSHSVALEQRRNNLQKKIALAQKRMQYLQEAKEAVGSIQGAEVESSQGAVSIEKDAVGPDSTTAQSKTHQASEPEPIRSKDVTTAASLHEVTRRDLLHRKSAAEQTSQLAHFKRLLSKQETLLEKQQSEIDVTTGKVSEVEREMDQLKTQLDAIPRRIDGLRTRQGILEDMLQRNKAEEEALRHEYL